MNLEGENPGRAGGPSSGADLMPLLAVCVAAGKGGEGEVNTGVIDS